MGLFRPYRIQESPDVIRKTCVLFLLHVETKTAESKRSDGTAGKDSAGRELWKVSNLELFRESLAVARVEDVVCVLKWVRHMSLLSCRAESCRAETDLYAQGLRHLTYGKTGFATASSPSSPLYWYTKFSLEKTSPSTAFDKLLLPSLPATSKQLLLEILPLMQLILAQTDRNAMTLRRLSRTFGIYLFGLAGKDKSYASWEEFYKIWNEAGEALEGCLKAYLRGQGMLPARLREIRDTNEGGRKIKVILVELESQGEWKKASISGSASRGRSERRSPVEALRVAFEANEGTIGAGEEEREAHALWTAIKDSTRRKLDDPTSVLDDESRRIYKLLNLRTDAPPIIITPFEPLAPLSSRGSPALSSVRASPVVPSPTLSSPTLTIKNVERTPTWTEFASGGFTTEEPFDGKEFGFVKPSERPKPKSAGSKRSVRSESAKSLKKMDYSPRSSPRSTVVSPPPLVPQPFSTVLSIRIIEVEEEFPDFYSDSLGDGICSSWPSFLISELNSSIVATVPNKINYLLLSDNLIPFRTSSTPLPSNPLSPVTPGNNKTTSSAKSFVSTSESTKRRFFSSGRMSGIFTSSLASKAKAASKSQSPPPLPPQTTATPPRPVRPVGELIKLESTPKREYITEFEGPSSSKPEVIAVGTAAAGVVVGAGATAGLVKSSSIAISVGDSLDSPSSIYDQIFQENDEKDAEEKVQQDRSASEGVEPETERKELRHEEDVVWPPREDVERAAARDVGMEDSVEDSVEEEVVVFAGIDGEREKEVVEEEESIIQSEVDSGPSPVLDNIDDTPAIAEQTDDVPVLSNPLESAPPEVDYIIPSPSVSAPPSPDIPTSSSVEALDSPPIESDKPAIDSTENDTVDSPSVQSPTPVLVTPSPSTNGSTVEEEESPIVGNIVPEEPRSVPNSPLAHADERLAPSTPVQESIDPDAKETELVERTEEVKPRNDVVESAALEQESGLVKKVSVETLKGTEAVEGEFHLRRNVFRC